MNIKQLMILSLVSVAACAVHDDRPVRFDYPRSNALLLKFEKLIQTSDGDIHSLMSIENRSNESLCVTIDSLKNKLSFEMQFYARGADGQLLDHFPFDLMPPPINGETIIEPGEIVEASYDLDDRFPSLGKDIEDIEFLVTYTFKRCASNSIEMTDTGWTAPQTYERTRK